MTTKFHVHLFTEDHRELEKMIYNGESSARTQTSARILLLTASSGENSTCTWCYVQDKQKIIAPDNHEINDRYINNP